MQLGAGVHGERRTIAFDARTRCVELLLEAVGQRLVLHLLALLALARPQCLLERALQPIRLLLRPRALQLALLLQLRELALRFS